jgi:predicted Zn finger-like uncharacterized protein
LSSEKKGEEMIIQCRQCRTKFKFDDAFMQGSGVWLRCSRCGHVYFQENPMMKAETELPSEPAKPLEEPIRPERRAELSTESPSAGYRDADDFHSLDKVIEKKNYLNEEINLYVEETPEESISGENEEVVQKELASPKSSGKIWKIAVWSVFVILIIPAVIYFLVFPELGEQIIKNVLVSVGISEPAKPEIVISQAVKLQDVRHRMINNYILGQIGIVEGNAINRADYPISRIQIKGEILDAYSVVLGEHTSYAGNILTDEELTNLSEEEILKKLSQPEGLNNSNDKIMPNGQIPFMIVFSREPAGVIKTTVVTVGAERLL